MVSGSPVPFYTSTRYFLLAPVSLAEWETYELLKDVDAVKYLLLCSLRRADKKYKARHVKWFAWKYRRYLSDMVQTVCRISLPPHLKDVEDVKDADVVSSIKTLYRTLSQIYGWTPKQISELSPAQLYVYLTGGKDGTGIVKMSVSEYQALRAIRNG